MANTYFGRVAIKGLGGTTAYTGTGAVAMDDTTLLSRSLSMSHDMDVIELPDRNGEMVGAVLTNKRKRVTVEFVPTNASGTATEANARDHVVFPTFTVGSGAGQVVLTGFGDDVDGTYNYLGGGSVGFTSEGLASMTLPLVRPEAGPMTIVL